LLSEVSVMAVRGFRHCYQLCVGMHVGMCAEIGLWSYVCRNVCRNRVEELGAAARFRAWGLGFGAVEGSGCRVRGLGSSLGFRV